MTQSIDSHDPFEIEMPTLLDEETGNDEGDLQVSGEPSVVAPAITAPTPSVAPQTAGFWIRFLAFEIDLMLLTIVSMGMGEVLQRALVYFSKGHLVVPVSVGFFVLGGIAYFSLFEASGWKGTPGKRFMGLRVTTLRGKRLKKTSALARTGFSLLSAVSLGAAFLAILFTRKKQALHDLAVNTLVLRKPEETLLPDSLARWESLFVQGAALVFLLPFAWAATTAAQDVASPLWRDHQRRGRVEQALQAVQPLQSAIESGVKTDRAYPKRIDEEMLKNAAQQARAVVLYNPANGVVTIQFGDPRKGMIASLSVYPIPNPGNASFLWSCRAFAIEDRLLPQDCKAAKS